MSGHTPADVFAVARVLRGLPGDLTPLRLAHELVHGLDAHGYQITPKPTPYTLAAGLRSPGEADAIIAAARADVAVMRAAQP